MEDPRGQAWSELLHQLEDADARVQRVTVAVKTAWPHHPLARLIRALQAIRSVDWLTAATLVAACGDSSQLSHSHNLMAFLGLVPSESSSGASRLQGGLSKTGNAQVRRVLIQGVHTYRFLPSLHGLVGCRVAARRGTLLVVSYEELHHPFLAPKRCLRRIATLACCIIRIYGAAGQTNVPCAASGERHARRG